MENFALIALMENLRPAMSELVIRRVVQHHPSGFIFQTRSLRLQAVDDPVAGHLEHPPPNVPFTIHGQTRALGTGITESRRCADEPLQPRAEAVR